MMLIYKISAVCISSWSFLIVRTEATISGNSSKVCPNKNAGFNKVKKLFYFHEIAYIFTSLQRVHVPI
jgi:hypothetical protein